LSKKRARLEAMRCLLSRFDYADKDHEIVGHPDPLIVGAPARFQEYDGALSPTPLAVPQH
jgi:polyphosphate kinase